LNEDISALILQAENEYNIFNKNAVKKAGDYAEECKKKQEDYIQELKKNWIAFENTENEKLANRLLEEEKKLEIKTEELKNKLKAEQVKNADIISERLKKEVLNLDGHS